MAHVIKKRGHRESFDETKIFESCHAALLQSGMEFTEASRISRSVVSKVGTWAGRKKHVQSSEVFTKVITELKNLDCHDAAYVYENLRDIS